MRDPAKIVDDFVRKVEEGEQQSRVDWNASERRGRIALARRVGRYGWSSRLADLRARQQLSEVVDHGKTEDGVGGRRFSSDGHDGPGARARSHSRGYREPGALWYFWREWSCTTAHCDEVVNDRWGTEYRWQ